MSNNNNIDNYLPKKIEEPSDISKRIQLTTELNKENNNFEQILSKPLIVLYEENKKLMDDNTAWQKAYEEQQKILSTWMLGQRAMKQLAYDLGKQLGLKESETTDKMVENMEKIIHQQEPFNNPEIISENMAKRFVNHQDRLKDNIETWKNIAKSKREQGL